MAVRVVAARLRAEMAQFKREWSEAAKAVDKTSESFDRTKNKAKETEKAIDESGTSVGRLSASLKNNRDEWDRAGAAMVKTGIALTAAGALSAKAAIDWQSQWAGVTKTVDGSAAEMAQLEDELRQLARTLPATHQEIAAVAEAAGQLGVERESIAAFTKTMIDLSETTNLTADEAATSIAQFMNVLGTAPDEVDNLGSALVALGNDGASTERDIIQMSQRIAGAAKTVGLAESDVLAIANTVASLGIEVEAGGSSISLTLAKIAKAAATGGDSLAAFAKVAGVSSEQFAKDFKERPAEAFTSFIEGLGRIQQEGGNVYGVLEDLSLSDVRVSQALIGMASSSDLLTDSLALGALAWEENTALSDEAAKRYATDAAKIQVAWNNIKDAAISAGGALAPVIGAIAEIVSVLAGAFATLPDSVTGALGALALFGGAGLIAVGSFSKLAGTIDTARTSMQLLRDVSPLAASSLSTFARTAGRAAGALAVLTAAQVASEAITKRNSKEMDELGDSLRKLGESGKTDKRLADIFGEDLGGKTNAFAKDLKSLGEVIGQFDEWGDDNAVTRTLRGIMPPGTDLNLRGQINAIKDLDVELSDMAQDSAEDALEAFDAIRVKALEGGASVDELARAFPGMVEVLRATSSAAGGTTDKVELLTNGVEDLAAADAAAKESAQGISDSFIDISEGLDDANVSLDDWLTNLGKQADALASFADNAAEASRRGLDEGMIKSLAVLGPTGALMMEQLAQASDKELAAAGEDWRKFQQQNAESTDKIAGAIDGITGDFYADFRGRDHTKKVIDTIRERLADLGLHGNSVNKYIDIYVRKHDSGYAAPGTDDFGLVPIPRRATGGAIHGLGTGTSDSIPAMLSNGEHVVTAAEVDAAGGQDAMYRIRAAIRAGVLKGFADGGAVEMGYSMPSYSSVGSTGSGIDLNRLAEIVGAKVINIPVYAPEGMSINQLADAVANVQRFREGI